MRWIRNIFRPKRGWVLSEQGKLVSQFMDFERDACAKVARDMGDEYRQIAGNSDNSEALRRDARMGDSICNQIAIAIEARKVQS